MLIYSGHAVVVNKPYVHVHTQCPSGESDIW